MRMPNIVEDKRPIEYICGDRGGEALYHSTTSHGSPVTAIVPYSEDGEMAPVIWFAIYTGGDLPSQRVQGKFVETITYADPPEAS